MLFLRLPLLLAFLFAPGYLAVSLLLSRRSCSGGAERLFLSAVLGCGAVALLAELLGLAGRFGLPALIPAWAVLCGTLLYFARHRLAWIGALGWREWAAVVLLVLVGLAIFLPPSHVVFGWSDEGSYPDITGRMSEEGDIHTRAEVVAEVAPERRDLLFFPNQNSQNKFQAYLYKQYYITDYEAGRVVPQFYFVWPSLMAVTALFLGTDNMFYAMTIVALLSLAGIFLLARRLLRWRWALVALALAALSPLMVYFSKYSTSEMFTLAIFLAAGLTLLEYQEEEDDREAIGLAVMAALFFLLFFLVRIDSGLLLPPLFLVMFWRRINGDWGKPDSVFTIMLLLGFFLAMLAGRFTSAPYFSTLFNYGLNGTRKFLAIALLALAVVMAVLFFVPERLRGLVTGLRKWKRQWQVMAWLALVAAFIFFYFIRPEMAAATSTYGVVNTVKGPSYDNQNLVRWGWYFTFPGLLLIFAGYGAAITSERRKSWTPLLVAGIFTTFFYLWSMRCIPLHILVMRRTIPVIFPLAVLMMAYALKRLWHWPESGDGPAWKQLLRPLGMIVSILLFIYLAIFNVSASWPIFGLSEGGNQREVVAELSGAAADGTILLDFNAGDLLGPPLFTFYDQPNAWLSSNEVLTGKELDGLLSDLGFPRRPVYLLWRPSLSGSQVRLAEGLRLEEVTEVVWHEEGLETSFEHRPDHRVNIDETFILYRIVPDDQAE